VVVVNSQKYREVSRNGWRPPVDTQKQIITPSLLHSRHLNTNFDSTYTLETQFESFYSVKGVAFDLEAYTDVTIYGIDVQTSSIVTNSFEIWTRQGSWSQDFVYDASGDNVLDSGLWTMVLCGDAQGNGVQQWTELPRERMDYIRIPSASIVGIYVTIVAYDVELSGTLQVHESEFLENNGIFSSSELSILPGASMNYPFKVNTLERMFSGRVIYTTGLQERSDYLIAQECRPSSVPSQLPTLMPSTSQMPSLTPTNELSRMPSADPSITLSTEPTLLPTWIPTIFPTILRSNVPTFSPSFSPTIIPTSQPSLLPTISGSHVPTLHPSSSPTSKPTLHPSLLPTFLPSFVPSSLPSTFPTNFLSLVPSSFPSFYPTLIPTLHPSVLPTILPSHSPSMYPSIEPSSAPTKSPSFYPSKAPSFYPSKAPSSDPTSSPSLRPSSIPSLPPTFRPSTSPSFNPSTLPSIKPSNNPTAFIRPSNRPSSRPSNRPSNHPSTEPSDNPSQLPSSQPSSKPSSVSSATSTAANVGLLAAAAAAAAGASAASAASRSTEAATNANMNADFPKDADGMDDVKNFKNDDNTGFDVEVEADGDVEAEAEAVEKRDKNKLSSRHHRNDPNAYSNQTNDDDKFALPVALGALAVANINTKVNNERLADNERFIGDKEAHPSSERIRRRNMTQVNVSSMDSLDEFSVSNKHWLADVLCRQHSSDDIEANAKAGTNEERRNKRNVDNITKRKKKRISVYKNARLSLSTRHPEINETSEMLYTSPSLPSVSVTESNKDRHSQAQEARNRLTGDAREKLKDLGSTTKSNPSAAQIEGVISDDELHLSSFGFRATTMSKKYPKIVYFPENDDSSSNVSSLCHSDKVNLSENKSEPSKKDDSTGTSFVRVVGRAGYQVVD